MYFSNNIKLVIFVLFLILFIPFISFAQAPDTTVYQEICSIRKMFCGGGAMAVVIGAVVIIGFLTFVGKANMGVLMITTFGLVVFVSADLLFEALFIPPSGADGVVEACSCN